MEKIIILKDILLKNNNVVLSVKTNLNKLKTLIPEICDMIGFEHNHPHHFLDVWEHTLYALSFSPNNFDIRLALLLHDVGKPHCYQDAEVRHFKGHPEVSANITKNVLERLGFENNYVNYICEIIKLHDTPLTKENIVNNVNLSKIIFEVQKCDAFAHNPNKNEKRLKYIEETAKIFEKIENEK